VNGCVVGEWLLKERQRSNELDHLPLRCSGPLSAWLHPAFEPLLGRYEQGAWRWTDGRLVDARQTSAVCENYLSPDQIKERLSTVPCTCPCSQEPDGGCLNGCRPCNSTGRVGIVCEGHMEIAATMPVSAMPNYDFARQLGLVESAAQDEKRPGSAETPPGRT
jgi:hypothetical protein